MDYKKHELPEFLDMLKSLIDDQMKKTLTGRGKCELCEQYKRLEKAEDEGMTPAQRQAHSSVYDVLINQRSHVVINSYFSHLSRIRYKEQ